MDTLKNLSTREKQAYGALCLHRFCRAEGIVHSSIEELIEHLLSILVSEPLDVWERSGAMLRLTGRGDPMPDDLNDKLPADARDDFRRLVDFVVEIGLADMYGRPTMEPLNYLLRSLAILDAHGIKRPDANELFGEQPWQRNLTEPSWGQPVSLEVFEHVRSSFR